MGSVERRPWAIALRAFVFARRPSCEGERMSHFARRKIVHTVHSQVRSALDRDEHSSTDDAPLVSNGGGSLEPDPFLRDAEGMGEAAFVLAIFDSVMEKQNRALVRRDTLQDLLDGLRDLGCEYERPNDSAKWKRVKRAYAALKKAGIE